MSASVPASAASPFALRRPAIGNGAPAPSVALPVIAPSGRDERGVGDPVLLSRRRCSRRRCRGSCRDSRRRANRAAPTPTRSILTSIGSAMLAGVGTSPVAALVSSVRSCAPSPRTTMPRDKSAPGFQVSATSCALACVSGPRQVMRRMRTVSSSEPVAPSISSAPPLRATTSRTTRSMPAWSREEDVRRTDEHRRGGRRCRRTRAAPSGVAVRGGGSSRGGERSGQPWLTRQNVRPDGELHPHLVHVLAVGDVEAERAERRAHARAEAVAEREVRVRQRVDGVAGVEERGESPELVDPVDRVDARHRIVATRDDGAVLGPRRGSRNRSRERVVLPPVRNSSVDGMPLRLPASTAPPSARKLSSLFAASGSHAAKRPRRRPKLRVEMPGTPPPANSARHPARGRRDEIVDAAPVPLVFRIERVRGLRGRPVGLLLVVEVRRGERMLVALFDRVPARARGCRTRDQVFDVGALGARAIRGDPAGGVRRARELHRSRLDLRFEAAHRRRTASRGRRSSRRDNSRSRGNCTSVE